MTLRQRGFTLLEMLVTATVLLILASAVMPLARNGVRRQKELELRRDLREIRMAIDSYKQMADANKIKAPPVENNGYPESLDILVEGVQMTNKTSAAGKIRFLRRLPVDPITNKAEWGMRAMSDDPTSSSWSGGNVFDVYSLASGTGSNGIPYRQW
jgi:general secretion pathway protein G